MRRTSLSIAAALLVAACADEPAQPIAVGPKTPVPAMAEAAWDDRPQAAAWSALLLSALDRTGEALLAADPADATEFCPAFASLDREGRRLFYLGLISRMAQFESGFDPATTFQENFDDAQGNPVISRGLLQLSIESANAYPGCSLDDAQELHDPTTNLTCGVAILNRLVARDQLIGGRIAGSWRGGAAYWSVLRQTSPRREQIAAFTRTIDVCTS